MTIKVTRDKCCEPPEFEPYTITLEINNYDDHHALNYLAMCNSKVPDTLYQKAKESSGAGIARRAMGIRTRTKSLLLALSSVIPRRVDPNGG